MGRRSELAIVYLSAIAAGAVVAGTVAVILEQRIEPDLVRWALHAATIGFVALATIVLLVFSKDSLVHLQEGGDRYERLRRHGRLRSGTILLRSLTLIGLIILLVAALTRLGILNWEPPLDSVRRGSMLLGMALSIVVAYVHYQALSVDMERDRSDLRHAATALLAIAAAAMALSATYLTATGHTIGEDAIQPSDGPVFHLVAGILLAWTLSLSRSLPSLSAAVLDPGRITAGGYTPEKRSQFGPTLIAFTVLGGFLFVLLLFSAGILSVLQTAGENILVLVALGLMIVSIGVGIFLSFKTGTQRDRASLYKQATPTEVRDKLLILAISIPIGLLLVMMGTALTMGKSVGGINPAHWLHILTAGLLIAVGPYGLYAGKRQRRIRMMEERFPDFLRDLASSHRGGLTLVGAVQVASRGEYGPLSAEVTKMADQLTWHVSFNEALERMADRVRTPLVRRTISLILEASKSGGNTADVLMAAARDARELKTLERQRRINMSVYTLVIYVVFFVFLFVIGVLYGQFVPEILAANEATKGSQFEGAGGLDFGGVTLEDYRRFYVSGGMVQALGNGILAGVMGSGDAALGLRHAFWMVIFTYVTFAFILA